MYKPCGIVCPQRKDAKVPLSGENKNKART
jgi:hypothetical protein